MSRGVTPIDESGRILNLKTFSRFASCTIWLLALGLLGSGCVLKHEKPGQPLTRREYTLRYTGYRVTYLLKASPAEVENYLQIPSSLVSEAGMVSLVHLSGGNYKDLADRATFAIDLDLLGKMAPYDLLLIRKQPRETLWFMSEGERGKGLSILRFKLEGLNKATRVVFTFEKEEESVPAFRSMSEAINLNETIVKGADKAGARMQAHFDPGLSAKQLLEKGYRGELYGKFFQGTQSSLRTKASPDRVLEYVAGGEFSALEKKYQFDFNRCFLSDNLKPSLMQMELLGVRHQLDLLPGLRRTQEGYYSCYLIPRSNSFISRARMVIQPEQGGARIELSYDTEAPDITADAPLQMQLLVEEIPKALEQLLLSIQAGVENQIKS